MAKWQFKLKTTENYTQKWEDLPVTVTLQDAEDNPGLVSAVIGAMLQTENAYEVRANRTGSLQGYYFSTPKNLAKVRDLQTTKIIREK